MRLWLPVGGCHATAVDKDGLLHAVAPLSTRSRDRRFKRFVTKRVHPRHWNVACGARVVELYCVTALTTEGDEGALAMVWPPFVRSSHGERCRDCWQALGKQRPAEQWRSVGEVVA